MSGNNFFDKSFFDDQAVYIKDIQLEDLIFGIHLSKDEIKNYDDSIVFEINNFTSSMLSIKMFEEDKILHHFRKILWLIQSYCLYGWKNSVKAVNLLDNGTYHVHPGVNRCVAAKFLGCKKLETMISVHKDQLGWEDLRKGSKLISTEEDLRKELKSDDTILFRTESKKQLFIDKRKTDKFRLDFTYEFLGNDAWPSHDNFVMWNSLLYKSFPILIFNPNKYELESRALGKKFYYCVTQKETEISYTKEVAIQKHGISIELYKPVRDIFELLFFITPNHKIAKTFDDKVKIINHDYVGVDEKELFIPDHYV